MPLPPEAPEMLIKKCDSPVGDGNLWTGGEHLSAPGWIKKCDSPVGDGNYNRGLLLINSMLIKKCDSPVGDGNKFLCFCYHFYIPLRNVIPR